jgi:hypothetical protein
MAPAPATTPLLVLVIRPPTCAFAASRAVVTRINVLSPRGPVSHGHAEVDRNGTVDMSSSRRERGDGARCEARDVSEARLREWASRVREALARGIQCLRRC